MDSFRYPIGKPNIPETISSDLLLEWIKILEDFPTKLENLVTKLTNEQLNTTYRANGWTIRQVIHHCADSHHNSYTRFKWTLTENKPIIKPYYEDRWGELFDAKNAPIELSINLLKALHSKWVYFLRGLTKDDLAKTFIHPEGNEEISLKENIGIYAWHCQHHYAQIEHLLIRKKWK